MRADYALIASLEHEVKRDRVNITASTGQAILTSSGNGNLSRLGSLSAGVPSLVLFRISPIGILFIVSDVNKLSAYTDLNKLSVKDPVSTKFINYFFLSQQIPLNYTFRFEENDYLWF
jgi:hypothetical protein